MKRAALRNDIARTAFTSTTLSGYTQFELHFVERHSCTRMPRNLAIGHSTTNANNHGGGGAVGWLLVEANYKYESVAFAITMLVLGVAVLSTRTYALTPPLKARGSHLPQARCVVGQGRLSLALCAGSSCREDLLISYS